MEQAINLRYRGEALGRVDVRVRGVGRPPRGAEVGARERLPVEQVDVLVGGVEGIRRILSRRSTTVTNGEIIRKTLCLIEGTVVQVVIHHLRVILPI